MTRSRKQRRLKVKRVSAANFPKIFCRIFCGICRLTIKYQAMEVYGGLCKTLCKIECRGTTFMNGFLYDICKRTWIRISYGKVHTFTISSYIESSFISGNGVLLSHDVHASRRHMVCSGRLACHGILKKLCHGALFNNICFAYVAINSVLKVKVIKQLTKRTT